MNGTAGGMIPPGETARWTSASAFRPWTLVLAIAAFAAVWLLVILYVGKFVELGWVVTRFAGMFVLALAFGWLGWLASRVLPHLFAGRRLAGDERRDFIGYTTDLRWHGAKPAGADDERLPWSRLGAWAMRLAHGEILDSGERARTF